MKHRRRFCKPLVDEVQCPGVLDGVVDEDRGTSPMRLLSSCNGMLTADQLRQRQIDGGGSRSLMTPMWA
jgi:hypothetical protein